MKGHDPSHGLRERLLECRRLKLADPVLSDLADRILADQIFIDQHSVSVRSIRSVSIRTSPWLRSYPWPYAAKPFTNSTRLRNAIPDGPFAIQGF
jgi:hypothetical protein